MHIWNLQKEHEMSESTEFHVVFSLSKIPENFFNYTIGNNRRYKLNFS